MASKRQARYVPTRRSDLREDSRWKSTAGRAFGCRCYPYILFASRSSTPHDSRQKPTPAPNTNRRATLRGRPVHVCAELAPRPRAYSVLQPEPSREAHTLAAGRHAPAISRRFQPTRRAPPSIESPRADPLASGFVQRVLWSARPISYGAPLDASALPP